MERRGQRTFVCILKLGGDLHQTEDQLAEWSLSGVVSK